ncbi:MAG: UDP-N-acetylmuramoyl-L-alanyl-D-glutamate--2,6-diaminopimelate ligase [Microscillaceae bacterium]|jgi:UDP-N-acetylmuramoyl-L-alanyl-D-glutamate--2,6-diaminopimelate ligase|nr:UDP-N-acetylmuramoyl-L-alanyl-D-glutamate--2,6-diaminopimelate ligase [Microscillaceae bacterium]
MQTLKKILQSIDYQLVSGNLDQNIDAIEFDSRKARNGSMFVAFKGTNTDGHQYIGKAIELGSQVIVGEVVPTNLPEGITFIQVQNSAKALGQMAANFYDNPSQKLKVVGITGTNGKTTNVTVLYKLFCALGYRVGLLSTVENRIHETVIPSNLTTPDAVTIQALMAEMVKQGCTHCFMEASSHAIVQERIAGINFAGAVFTNITHDHLDFHQTFDNYIKAKKKLFDELPKTAFALVNIDDKRGAVMLQNCAAHTQKTFALRNPADFKGKIIENTIQGLFLEINQRQAWFRLIGDFNAYNLLSVFGVAYLLGESEEDVLTELSNLSSAPGRFEQVRSPQGITGIVDYAHTPDALKNVLETIEQLCAEGQQVITVVGCGGDRDKTKRPIMAKIAVEFSQQVILTSDNPRTEDPEAILADMVAGLSPSDKHKVKVIENRREAIKTAYSLAHAEDVILIAGKGHENYQEIQGVKYPFDDKEVLLEMFKQG